MKSKYKFLYKLIKRITNVNQSNNDTFAYYDYNVSLQSGTSEYVSVTIYYNDEDDGNIEMAEFSFDFLTYDLNFVYYWNDAFRNTVIDAFLVLEYGQRGIVVSDDTLQESYDEELEVLNHPDEYDEDCVKYSRKKYEYLHNLPIGRLYSYDRNKIDLITKDF